MDLLAGVASILAALLAAIYFSVFRWLRVSLPSTTTTLAFATGILFVPSLKLLIRRLPSKGRSGADSSIYGLEHQALNLELPPRSMWMNMGYWSLSSPEQQPFPSACEALLERVLESAGLLASEGSEPATKGQAAALRSRRPIGIIDVGIGCGDQSLHILRLAGMKKLPSSSSSSPPPPSASGSLPSVSFYLGITQEERQYRYAMNAVAKHYPHRLSADGPLFLLQGDGGDSSAWQDIAFRLQRRWHTDLSHDDDDDDDDSNEKAQKGLLAAAAPDLWILGLDSLYHLRPSRAALFAYARSIGAGIMAFDLLLAPEDEEGSQPMTTTQEMLLAVVCALTGTPRGNLLTPRQYRRQLEAAGYAAHAVEIVDVSARVFGPLAAYVGRRAAELGAVRGSLGPLRAAGWIFGWWARTGVVRGCIVVAKP